MRIARRYMALFTERTMIPDDTSISLWRVYFGIGNFLWELVRGLLHWISTGTRKLHLACQTIVRSRIMSARTKPSGEFVILPAFFFMYAFRILVLIRVLYVFNVLAPVRSKQNVRDKVGPLEDSAGDIITEGILMAEEINMHFSSVFTREDTSSLPVPETKFNGSEEEKLGQLIVTPEFMLYISLMHFVFYFSESFLYNVFFLYEHI